MKPVRTASITVAVILSCLMGSTSFGAIQHSFGTLAEATFRGSGIPNNAVAITTFDVGTDIITLGLTATPRYDSGYPTYPVPPVTNDGAGTFYAEAGAFPSGRALWNFNFFIKVNGTGTYQFKLFYDFNPAAGNGNLGAITLPLAGPVIEQDSQNLNFAWLTNPSYVTVPSYPSFDPNVDATYTFELEALNGSNSLASTSIDVIVGQGGATPEPATVIIWSLLGGLGLVFAWRKRKAA